MMSFHQPPCPNRVTRSSFQFAAGRGGGGGGGGWAAICEATLRHAATATTTKVGFPPLLLFFESFLEISLRSAKSRYGNRFRSSLFIEICFSCWDFKMVHGCVCNVRGISERRILFQFFGSVFYPTSNGYKTRVGVVFPPFC